MKRICLSLWHPPVRLLTMVAGALLCSASPLMAAPPADNPREEGQAIETGQQLRQQMRENNSKRCLDECLKYGYAAKT
ncbi:hypothetical protein [Pantoea agglomerans]|jgi:hypothetical protein|uniref:hypothetical protein n=1 Tax=Enterobacter agglomerans TaxID=549 RepID=UPI001F5B1C90|nr:hypothetical protein [Pantoea agglomerans]